MSIYSTFKTNNRAETDGRWFDLPTLNNDGTKPGFKLARMAATNPIYQAAIERLSKDFQQQIELDILTEAVAGPVMKSVFANTIVKDWRNIYGEHPSGDEDLDGEPIPFTVENAIAFFDLLPDLYLMLVVEAKKMANFRSAKIAEISEK